MEPARDNLPFFVVGRNNTAYHFSCWCQHKPPILPHFHQNPFASATPYVEKRS